MNSDCFHAIAPNARPICTCDVHQSRAPRFLQELTPSTSRRGRLFAFFQLTQIADLASTRYAPPGFLLSEMETAEYFEQVLSDRIWEP